MSGNRKAINLIGMAHRGGNTAVGRKPVRDSVHRRRAARIFLAADAGQAVDAEMRMLCDEHGVPLSELGDKKALGRALGRSEVAVVAVTDRGLAGTIVRAMRRNGEHSEGGAAGGRASSGNAVRRQV